MKSKYSIGLIDPKKETDFEQGSFFVQTVKDARQLVSWLNRSDPKDSGEFKWVYRKARNVRRTYETLA